MGQTNITTPIQIGSCTDPSRVQMGLRLEGYGSGYNESSDSLAGSSIVYTGPFLPGQGVLNLCGTFDSHFAHFSILTSTTSGNSDYGIALRSNSNISSGITLRNTFEDMYVSGAGIALIYLSGETDGGSDQLDTNSFYRIHLDAKATWDCIRINDLNTQSTTFREISCSHPMIAGAHVMQGSINLYDSTWDSETSGSPTGLIVLDDNPGVGLVNIVGNQFETAVGGTVFAPSNGRVHRTNGITNITNNVFTTSAQSSTALLFDQGATLTLTGNTFGTFASATTIYLTIQPPHVAGYEGLQLVSGSNTYSSQVVFTIDSTYVRQMTPGVPIQIGPLPGLGADGLPANCIYLSGNTLFHDANCNGSLDPGEGILNSESNSYAWGTTLWAQAGTTGATACQNRNLACVDAYPATGGPSVGCWSAAVMRTVYCQ
jgi:hypothetical protein